jgi:hypothetical protein
MIDMTGFYPVGDFNPELCTDPATGCEYPDTTGEQPGAMWRVYGLTTEPYIFQEGDLAGEEINNYDWMLLTANSWTIMKFSIDPDMYMKRDKSTPFDANGNPLMVNGIISNVDPGVNGTDAVNKDQLDNQTHDISDVNNLQSELDSKVNKAGDTMTGDLNVEADITAYKDSSGNQGNISAQGSINVGLNQFGNSAIAFNWDGTPGSVSGQNIFWNNTDNEFQVDITGSEGFTLWHKGNLDKGEFAPATHTHPISDVIDLQNALDAKVDKTGDTITGSLVVEHDLIGANVLSEEGMWVGVDASGDESAIHFNYGDTDIGAIYYNNIADEFQVDTSVGTNFTLWHAGNLNPDEIKSPSFIGIDNPVNGVLIETPVQDTDDISFRLEIKGTSFNSQPLFTEIEGRSNAGTLINVVGLQLGLDFDVQVFFLNNKLHFWFQPTNSGQSFNIGFFLTDTNGEIFLTDVILTDVDSPATSPDLVQFTKYIKTTDTIDADTLDGLDSSEFAPVIHNHDNDYVNVSGDTMTGDLDLGSNSLLNVADGVNATDGINKGQLDAHINDTNNPHQVTPAQIGAEPELGLGSAGQVLATNQAVDGKEWITVNTAEWGNITGDINNQTDLIDELNKKVEYIVPSLSTPLDSITDTGIYFVDATDAPGNESIGTLFVTNNGTVNQLWQTSKRIYTRSKTTDWGEWNTYASMVFDGESLYIDI